MNKFCTLFFFLIISTLAICDINNYCKINENFNITVIVFNSTTGEIVDDATCVIDIYKNESKIIEGASMSFDAQTTQYFYTCADEAINSSSLCHYRIKITKGNWHDYIVGAYQIVDELQEEKINNINLTVDNINSNLTTSNSSIYFNIWNYTNRSLTSDVTVNYNTIAETVWNYTTRALSSAGIEQIVQAVWEYGHKVINSVMIESESAGRYGITSTPKPSNVPSSGGRYK